MTKILGEKIKMTGDVPLARFGHTFTMLSNNRAVLFGGAVTMQNGKCIITNDTYIFDFPSKWTRLTFKSQTVPSERAAHAATAISDTQMIIYGGAASGNSALKDELYILDIKNQPVWKIMEFSNKNPSPGQRYGHTMQFIKPHIVVFGGNSGCKAQNDVWLLNIKQGPFVWQKYQFKDSKIPCPRVYHSAAICQQGAAQGMMVIFGGRRQLKKQNSSKQNQKQTKQSALNDIWGLRRHRDGSWDWITPPLTQNYTPIGRYQHQICFVGSNMIVVGGRSSYPDETVSIIEVYDTQKSQWSKASSISRYRHALAFHGSRLIVHGGFEPELANQPLDSMLSIDINLILNKNTNIIKDLSNQVYKKKSNNVQNKALTVNQNIQNMINTATYQIKHKKQQENQIAARGSRVKSVLNNIRTNKQRDLTPTKIINQNKNIRLAPQVVVAKGDSQRMQIQRIPVNSLLQQSKKLIMADQQIYLSDLNSLQLADSVIQTLLYQQNFPKNKQQTLFPFKKQKVIRLCQEASKIVLKDTSLVCLRAPTKIFGSLFGRFSDLIRIFQNFGFPDDSQMQINQYLFLGNYVDKGFQSLQLICLLMALKIRYPEHVTLLRGRHEDSAINRSCGFGQECIVRLADNINDSQSVFNMINNFFDCLPLAAAIQDKFLCVHSGIGRIDNLYKIKDIIRPIKVSNPLVTDLLWSNNTSSKKIIYDVSYCSQQKIQQFLDSNGLDMIINTKEGSNQEIEQNGPILSLFTATDYGHSKNTAAMLKINKNLSILPCLIQSNNVNQNSPWISDISIKSNLTFNNYEMQLRNNLFII